MFRHAGRNPAQSLPFEDMTMTIYPLRMMICRELARESPLRPEDIYDKLHEIYKNEKHFTVPALKDHLQAMKSVGIVDVKDVMLDKDNNLIQFFALTDYGMDQLQKNL